jgi:hypothetical protein
MLNTLASIATLIFTTWLLIVAWIQTKESPWLYYFGAALLILVWSRPWSNRDRYRTYDSRLRMFTYLLLVGVTVSVSYFFLNWTPLLITIQVIFLALLEGIGWTAMKRA